MLTAKQALDISAKNYYYADSELDSCLASIEGAAEKGNTSVIINMDLHGVVVSKLKDLGYTVQKITYDPRFTDEGVRAETEIYWD